MNEHRLDYFDKTKQIREDLIYVILTGKERHINRLSITSWFQKYDWGKIIMKQIWILRTFLFI